MLSIHCDHYGMAIQIQFLQSAEGQFDCSRQYLNQVEFYVLVNNREKHLLMTELIYMCLSQIYRCSIKKRSPGALFKLVVSPDTSTHCVFRQRL